MNGQWIFKCPYCETESNADTNLEPRTKDDKYTEKRINPAVICSSCEKITIIDNIDRYLDQEIDWIDTNISKPGEFVNESFPSELNNKDGLYNVVVLNEDSKTKLESKRIL